MLWSDEWKWKRVRDSPWFQLKMATTNLIHSIYQKTLAKRERGYSPREIFFYSYLMSFVRLWRDQCLYFWIPFILILLVHTTVSYAWLRKQKKLLKNRKWLGYNAKGLYGTIYYKQGVYHNATTTINVKEQRQHISFIKLTGTRLISDDSSILELFNWVP